MDQSSNWYKNNPDDEIWWLDNASEQKGVWIFSFDKKKKFNMFEDYPWKLTKEEKEIFDEENPFWKDFFSDRS